MSGIPAAIIINEYKFQNKYRPTLKDGRSYPLVKRGVYYTAREISAQLGRITQKTNYSDIEKVISIWLVNEGVPKELQNTASRYYINKEDIIGKTDEPESDYDLIEVVIVRRGECDDVTEPIFDYLKAVYSADLEAIDKYTPASDNPEVAKEVADMPGMSQTIYKNGYDSGYDSCIVSLATEGNISVELAAEKLKKTTDEVQKLINDYVAKAKEQATKQEEEATEEEPSGLQE